MVNHQVKKKLNIFPSCENKRNYKDVTGVAL